MALKSWPNSTSILWVLLVTFIVIISAQLSNINYDLAKNLALKYTLFSAT